MIPDESSAVRALLTTDPWAVELRQRHAGKWRSIEGIRSCIVLRDWLEDREIELEFDALRELLWVLERPVMSRLDQRVKDVIDRYQATLTDQILRGAHSLQRHPERGVDHGNGEADESAVSVWRTEEHAPPTRVLPGQRPSQKRPTPFGDHNLGDAIGRTGLEAHIWMELHSRATLSVVVSRYSFERIRRWASQQSQYGEPRWVRYSSGMGDVTIQGVEIMGVRYSVSFDRNERDDYQVFSIDGVPVRIDPWPARPVRR